MIKKILLFIGILISFMLIIYIFGNFLNYYSEGIIALCALVGIISGSSWLDTSQKKIKGKLEIEIARNYLKGVLELRDAVKIVRNPFISLNEMQTALKADGFKPDEYEDKEKVNRSVYSLRWNKVQKSWTKLEEVLTEAEISWGYKAVEVQEDLDKLIRELKAVIFLFVNYPEDFHKKYTSTDNPLYGSPKEDDEFSIKINDEVEKIRNFLKKHL